MNELSTFDAMTKPARELVDSEELREARKLGWLIEDVERRRPRYFDGRFLTGGDLTRDQKYFLSRQLDLGRMSGGGVLYGLDVQPGVTSAELVISAGHGVTPAGASVLLGQSVSIDVTDAPAIQRLDATFGLEVRPNAPVRNPTGLFVVALRNVEFTANPIATYPRDLQSQRRIEDGEIIEATAVTLIPFESVAPADLTRAGQARLAREIFVRSAPPPLSAEALPIAVVSIRRGEIQWIDRYLVRRDASVDDSLGFGALQLAVREAHLRQYVEHLAALAAPSAFAASDHFQALPPFGPLPSSNLEIQAAQIFQSYFPPEFDVELTIVPDDELAALQAEALSLAPIDLTARAEVSDATCVQVLIPIARTQFASFVSRLEGKLTRSPLPRSLRPRARKTLQDTLIAQQASIIRQPQAVPVDVNLLPWQDALALLGDSPLFYVRRRRLSQIAFSFSRFQAFPPDSPNPSETLHDLVVTRLIEAGELATPDDDPLTQTERSRFDFMLRKTTNEVLLRVEALLSRAVFDAAVFVNAVVAELAYRTRVRLEDLLISPDARQAVIGSADGVIAPEGSAPVRVRALRLHDVERVTSRYTRPGLGQGFAFFPPAALTPAVRAVLAESFRVPELDQALRDLTVNSAKQTFAARMLELAQHGDIGGLRDLVDLQFSPPDVEEFPPIAGFPGSQTAIELGEGRLYTLIHTFSPPARKTALSDLFDLSAVAPRPNFAQAVVVSMILADFVVSAWRLDLTEAGTANDFENVNRLLGRIANWDRENPFDFNLEDLTGTGTAEPDFTPRNIELNQLFNRWQSLETRVPAGSLATLSSVLASHGFTMSTERFRILGFTGESAALVERILNTSGPAQAQLVRALEDQIDLRNATFLSVLTGIAQGDDLP